MNRLINGKNYGFLIVLLSLIACAPSPSEWRRVVTIQPTAIHIQAGKLGILPFRCSNTVVGNMVADSVATNLLDSAFVIIERAYLIDILREQQLGFSGLTEITDYRKIGQLANVDLLLIGTVNLQEGVAVRGFGKFVTAGSYSFVSNASARIVSLKTGQIMVSCTYQIPSGAGSDHWTQPEVVGETIARAFKEVLGN